MIFKKKTKTAEQYRRKRVLWRIAFVLGCIALFILGFFAAGPVLTLLGF